MGKGVPANHVILEREACNTVDNAWRTARILVERGITHVQLVTSRFHTERARRCFEPILAAFGKGIAISFVDAFDTYDEAALAARMRVEERCIRRFERDVNAAAQMIQQ